MEDKTTKAIFNDNSLKRFIDSEGKIVKSVICYLWQNNINPANVIELIDSIELFFFDETKLVIGSNDDATGLEVIDFNFEEQKREIEIEHKGKIKLYAVNASLTNMWQNITGKKLISVQITKEGDKYLSDSLLLNFENDKRIVAISPVDGIIIDFYEE